MTEETRMEPSSFENPWIRKFRVLSQIVIVSVTLNVGLILSLIYVASEKKIARGVKETATPESPVIISTATNAQVVKNFFQYSFQDLLSELFNDDLIEYGYRRRDLALACMVQFHYFDVEKALGKSELQKRETEFIHSEGGEVFKLTLFPALNDAHFVNIIAFAEREEWPLVPEGLFYELKKNKDSGWAGSLQEAFFATREFYTIHTLFARWLKDVDQEEVLGIVLDGDWECIEEFTHNVHSALDLSIDSLRQFLTSYVGRSSKAAHFWLRHDAEYVLKKVDDRTLYAIINQLEMPDLQATLFLKQVVCSVRSDAARVAAGKKLYTFAGESAPEPYDHEVCMKRFLPSLFTPSSVVKEAVTKFDPVRSFTLKHRVTEGDSLWKIAKKYHVDLDELIIENALDPEQCLRVGMELKIPTRQ